QLARGGVPHAPGVVVAGGGDALAVRAEPGLDDGLMVLEGTELLAGGRLPELGRPVRARGEYPATVRREGGLIHRAVVPQANEFLLPVSLSPCLLVFDLPNPGCFVVAGR